VDEERLSAIRALELLGSLWPSAAAGAKAAADGFRRELEAESDSRIVKDARVPVRNPAINGPLNVYYYDYFADIPGADFTKIALASADNGDVLAYEALNLADGRTSISGIRDRLSGLYAPVSLEAVAEYFDLLAKAGVVTLR
jgi:hypothetical protein